MSISHFPQPIISEPSPYWITNTFRETGVVSHAYLKRWGVAELGKIVPKEEKTLSAQDLGVGYLPSKILSDMKKRARDAQTYSFWEQRRETYLTHPEMSRNLMNMKSSVKIPAGVFRRLRNPDPLFLIPGAIPITHGDGLPGRIVGFQVAGAFSPLYSHTPETLPPGIGLNDVRLASTHADGINCYCVTILSEVHSPDGGEIRDFDSVRLAIPLSGNFSVDGLVDEVSSRFLWSGDMGAGITEERKRGYLRAAAKLAVSHLLYATSRTVDLEEKAHNDRPPAARKAGGSKAPRPARVRKLGFQMGAAIEDFKRRPARAKAESAPTGKKVRPHTRGAHLHMYLVGPGRKEIDFNWLDPIDVNARSNDGSTVTIHPMGY